MIKIRLFTLLFTLVSFISFGQEDYQGKFLTGKNLYKEGKYLPAMEIFLPLTKEDPQNKFSEYAHYYYALSGLKAGKLNESRMMLLQLQQRYPTWEKMEEVFYLFANIAFEQQKYHQGISFLQKLNSKDLKADGENLQKFYVSKITSLDTLKSLQKNFPADNHLANLLAQRMSVSRLTEKDKMLFEYLLQEYKIDKDKLSKFRTTRQKESYNVAVLLPFMEKTLTPDQWQRNYSYVYDLYQGIRMAVDSLKANGITINLYAYDTEKDDQRISAILQLPELLSMDMVVGPVSPSAYSMFSEFALKNQIISVNPLSSNGKLIENNPFCFLFQPSIELMASNAAAFTSGFPKEAVVQPEKKGAKPVQVNRNNVMIFYGTEGRDSLLAVRYRDTLLSKGFKIAEFEQVSGTKIKKLQTSLDSAKVSVLNHIFVATGDERVAANVISSLEVSRFTTPVITRSEWLDFPLLSYEQFERRNVHFLFPDFLDYDKPSVNTFKNGFISRTYKFPETYAYQGYEMMMQFGEALGKYGNFFKAGLASDGFIPGYILQGVNYSSINSNQYIPITKFEAGQMVVVNPR
ncbi:MAG: hypothetical protein ACK40G_03615 [Cytophagaceae bacterium]